MRFDGLFVCPTHPLSSVGVLEAIVMKWTVCTLATISLVIPAASCVPQVRTQGNEREPVLETVAEGPLPEDPQPRAHGPQDAEPCVGEGGLTSEVYEEIAEASGGISIRVHSPEEFGDALDYILQEITERLRNPDRKMETRRVKRPCPPSDVSPDGPEPFPASLNLETFERLVRELVSEDAKTAREAEEQLHRMPYAVPALFERLVEANWDLKPPLLEVLARVKGGRDYARSKLFYGMEAEKTYAALLYELIDQGEDTESCEYAAMVEVLLKALKSEDKKLRAAAGLAVIYEENSAPVVFQHLHEIIPALISSFDTDLVIDRRWRGDPSDIIFFGICYRIDVLIGNRFAFQDFLSDPQNHSVRLEGDDTFSLRRTVPKFLSANRQEINKLKSFWRNWWNKHSELSLREIGIAIIERNLRVLDVLDPRQWADHDAMAHGSLELWTQGIYSRAPDDWASWWSKHKETYEGPIQRTKE